MAGWGGSLFGWGSLVAVLVAVGASVSSSLGLGWTMGTTKYFIGLMQSFAIPVQYVPTVILVFIVTAFIFYNVGYYICFLEEDPDEVAAEQDQIGFVGKHYIGKPNETIQMVICCRSDLEMSTGKIALQVGHGTVGIFRRMWQKNRGLTKHWEDCGQAKVLLKVPSEAALLAVQSKGKARGLPSFVVRDKAATMVDSELKQGNRTAVVLLGPPSVLQDVVGDLALLE